MEWFLSLLLLIALGGMGAGDEWHTESEMDPIDDTRSAFALRVESPGSWTRVGRYRLLALHCEESQVGEEPELGVAIFWDIRIDDFLNLDAKSTDATRRTMEILTRFGDTQARRWTYERVETSNEMFVTFPHDMDRFLREAKKATEVALRLENDVTSTHTTVFDLTGSARIINAMERGCGLSHQLGTPRIEAEKRKAEAERQHIKAEKKKAEAERKRIEELRRREAERALQEQTALDSALLDEDRRSLLEAGRIEYIAQIKDKVERNWLRPPGTASGLKCVVRVSQLPGGDVVEVAIQTGSGNVAFDRSVEEAVLRSSPLPVPKDPSLFDRNIVITFEPEV
ncbi:MAG: cell envelope integrity protein TolA [Thiotrichales bacterium]|nr:cell envelope integrity protein TolA [Thiotrichales bacterium]